MSDQLQLDTLVSRSKPTNVASVPQRSLFRYPGGKTWLIPQIRRWLGSFEETPETLVEPFVGGGIVSLTAVSEGLVERAHIVELDPEVAAVWRVVCSGKGDSLAGMILDFEPTLASVTEVIEGRPRSDVKRAFATIVKNRTFHGGILARGSAPMKNGENGKGIASRWYPETLARRINGIGKIQDRLTFVEGDAFTEIPKFANDPDAVFFIDPPYTAGGKRAGRRLYTHSELDHRALFALSRSVAGDPLLTYDNADDVRDLAECFSFEWASIPMKNTHNAELSELLIGRSLKWLPTQAVSDGS